MSGNIAHHPTSVAAPTVSSANNLRAWLSAVLIPEVLIGAMFLGEGLISVLGYSEEKAAPLLLELLASAAVLVIAMIPAALAVLFGRRARREGHGLAIVPVALGLAVLAYLAVSLIVAAVGGQVPT